jgi:hypothetical protein
MAALSARCGMRWGHRQLSTPLPRRARMACQANHAGAAPKTTSHPRPTELSRGTSILPSPPPHEHVDVAGIELGLPLP